MKNTHLLCKWKGVGICSHTALLNRNRIVCELDHFFTCAWLFSDRLSETENLHSSTKQDLRYLEEQLQEERDRRIAVEEALSAAQDQIRR